MFGVNGYERASKGEVDLEQGTLYPGLSYEENQLRWGFIRKVYSILASQILLTTAVSFVTVFFSPANVLAGNSSVLLFFCILPLILICPLYVYRQKHPVNLVLLGLFTACMSLTFGVICANTEGRIVLEAFVLTSAVVMSLTGYTFWASKKGKDFSYMGSFLFTSLLVLLLAGFIQMFVPMGSVSSTVYAAAGAIVFSAFLVFDTQNLIKRYDYDDYVWASVNLYLDILNLFIKILQLLKGNDR